MTPRGNTNRRKMHGLWENDRSTTTHKTEKATQAATRPASRAGGERHSQTSGNKGYAKPAAMLPTAANRSAHRADTTNGSTSPPPRSEEHTSELQSRGHLVCRLLLEKK